MKKLSLLSLFFMGTIFAFGQVDQQQDRQQTDEDRIQQLQEQKQPAQVDMERNARIDAQRTHNELEAKKKAKRLRKAEAEKEFINQEVVPKK